MKDKYMRQIYMGMIGDLKNLEEHFARMAAKGWLICEIGQVSHRYRAVEPCRKRFFVDLLPQITAFDYPDNEDAEDYRAICEASGWRFVAANKQFHVFCADAESPAPMPIHTDPAIEAKIYLKASRKYELWVFLYAIAALWFFAPFGKGAELFLSNFMIFSALAYSVFLAGFFWNLGFLVSWTFKTRRAAKRGEALPSVNYRRGRLRIRCFAVCSLLFFLLTVAGLAAEILSGMSPAILLLTFLPLSGVAAGFWFRRQVDTRRRTRGANIRKFVITLVIMEIFVITAMSLSVRALIRRPLGSDTESLDGHPALHLADIGVAGMPEGVTANIKGTPAVPLYYEYREFHPEGSVNTKVYRPISLALSKSLYRHFTEELLERYEESYRALSTLSPEEAGLWGAEEGGGVGVFGDEGYTKLLLRKGKTVLALDFSAKNASREEITGAVRALFDDLE